MAVAVFVLVVAMSERYGGPLTVQVLRDTVASGASAATGGPREPTVSGEIHLTFDDGPSFDATPEILDLLADHDATAVFFPIGNQVAGGAEMLRRAVAEGHRIGNHTWDHDHLDGLTPSAFDASVGRTQAAIERTVGTTPACLRPPGGLIDETATTRAAAAGLTVEMWDVDPHDWRRPGVGHIVDEVIDNAADGAVVLLHDGGGDRSQTVDALGEILDRLGARGYRFTAVPHC